MNIYALNALYILYTMVQDSIALPVDGKIATRSIDSGNGLLDISEQSLNQLVKAAEKVAEEIQHSEDELDSWEAPLDMRKNYPYYLSGYDEEGRPIWIAEVGKWDIRKVVEGGTESTRTFSKYVAQASRRIIKSMKDKSPLDEPVTEVFFILDYDGLQVAQISHAPTISYLLQMARQYRGLITEHIHTGILINANYVAETLISLMRPILGEVMEKVEVFGTQKSKWIPELLKRLPKDQIPDWYGGAKSYTPVKIFG